MATMKTRAIAVASPAPSGPIAGAPNFPNTSAQQTTALKMLASTMLQTIGRVMCPACSEVRSAMNRKNAQ